MPTRSHLHRYPVLQARGLVIRCRACGHECQVPEPSLHGLRWYGETLGEIEPKLKCSQCGAKGQVEMRVAGR